MSKKIYISGAISGDVINAKIKFINAEKYLINNYDCKVINPLKLNKKHDKTWESYMRVAIKAMMNCGCIYMLKNCEKSNGATIEHWIAKKLMFEIIYEK